MASSASPAHQGLSESSSPAADSAAASASIMAHQMEVDPPTQRDPDSDASAHRSPLNATTASANASSSSRSARQQQQPPARYLEQELIPPNSRLYRLPTAVPSPHTLNKSTPTAAIQSQSNNLTNYPGQDVHHFVNSSASSTQSTVTRHPQHLETSVSSSSQPFPYHVLSHPIRRPRTSNHIVRSITDLAAHHGIPQLLPPAPRTNTTHNQSTQAQQQQSAISTFHSMSANYLNMLNNKKPAEINPTPAAPTMMSTSTQPEPSASMIPTGVMSNENFDAMFDLDPNLFDFGGSTEYSPGDTPYSEFLETPLIFDQNDFPATWGEEPMLTSPMMTWSDDTRPLFGGIHDDEISVQQKAPETAAFDNLYTISPQTPALHSFNDFQVPSSSSIPSHPNTSSNAASSVTADTPVSQRPIAGNAQRRSKPTGIRKGVTPDSLLDVDAPTQPRKYVTPSATSKKEVPAVFARKRARSAAFGEEDDELIEELPLDATEAQIIANKRRQNTVAARKSRRRKLEQYQRIERDLDHQRKLKELWEERANVLLSMLRTTPDFANYPDFPADPLPEPVEYDDK